MWNFFKMKEIMIFSIFSVWWTRREFGQGLSCLRRRGKPILCARLTTDYTQAYSEKKIATLTMKESRRKKHLETSSYASSLLLSTTGNRVRSFTLWNSHWTRALESCNMYICTKNLEALLCVKKKKKTAKCSCV